MEQFKNVNAALGVDSLEAVDEVVSLNADQLQALDSALEPEDNSEIQEQLDTANSTIAERDETIVGLNEQVETANSTIAERDATIEELNGTIADLKNEAATPPKKAVTKTDADGKEKPGKAVTDKYENVFDGLEDVSKEYLGKSLND